MLERILRRDGRPYNVINLGVRGYGTDQSVRLALESLKFFPSSRVIYYFTGNDFDNNNTVRRRGRRFGKSVFIRREEGGLFEEEFSPVPRRWPAAAYIHVGFDAGCRPRVVRGDSLLAEHFIRDRMRGFGDGLYLVRLLNRAMYRLWLSSELERLAEFRRVRARCRGYMEDQMRFLLHRFREGSIEDVTVIGLADAEASGIFERLVEDGTVDRFIDLRPAFPPGRNGVEAFHCRHDEHFCADGNELIAAHVATILENVPAS